jgi:5-methylcytosine-specific restriction protein A
VTYNTTARRPLTKKQRSLFLLEHGSRCYWCGEPIVNDEFDDEHVLARELGGTDAMSNRKPIHRRPCHKEKTAEDRRLIAKGNRIRKKISGLDPVRRKPPKPIRSRGFDKTLTKRFNGTVERR